MATDKTEISDLHFTCISEAHDKLPRILIKIKIMLNHAEDIDQNFIFRCNKFCDDVI